MKLTYEDKVKIYHLRKSGCSWSEIIAYNLSTSANLQQLKTMLEEAFPKEAYQGTILHSD